VVTRQLQVECSTEKVRRPKTDVLPLSHATNQGAALSAETASVSDVIPTTRSLLYTLRGLKPTCLVTLRNALLAAMESRCKVFEESTECLLATILDPRYKAKYFTTAEVKEDAEQKLKNASNADSQHSTDEAMRDTTGDNKDENDPWESFRHSVETAYDAIEV